MKSILFKQDILRAKLAVLESQGEAVTRRVMKLQPKIIHEVFEYKGCTYAQTELLERDKNLLNGCIKSPFQPWETVYVREAWCQVGDGHDMPFIVYKITTPDQGCKWRSPLFMPSWAARTFLQITAISPERLVLPLSPEELKLEGGGPALEYLKDYEGMWLWRIALTLKKKE